jgi:hypothetical protein
VTDAAAGAWAVVLAEPQLFEPRALKEVRDEDSGRDIRWRSDNIFPDIECRLYVR